MMLPITYNEIETRIKPITEAMFEQYIKDMFFQAMNKQRFYYKKN